MARVGGDVDAYCTRCELVLAHTVVAMVAARPVKVQCNTCHAVHAFRSGPPGTAARAASPRPRDRKTVLSFDEVLAGKDVAAARPYTAAASYAVGEVVRHPAFGLGYVTAVRPGKVEIAFRSDVKTLVHGRARQ